MPDLRSGTPHGLRIKLEMDLENTRKRLGPPGALAPVWPRFFSVCLGTSSIKITYEFLRLEPKSLWKARDRELVTN